MSKWISGYAHGRMHPTILLICICLFALFGARTASAAVSSLSCSSASVSGFANNACTVNLNAPAPTGGLSVGLSSSNAAVAVPATVTVPAGATSAGFTAKASAVGSTQNATLSASSAGVTTTYVMTLTGVVSTMSVNTTSVAFGTVPVNTAATQLVTLKSVGTWPLDINSASVQGTGFSVSGGTFPAKLSPGQSLTLTVQFNPASAGAVTGKLNISSNSSAGNSTAVSLTATGGSATAASLSSLSCSSASMTGNGNDACTVQLTGPAPSSGFSVSLSSSSTAVVVPASVTVAAGATSAGFTASVSAVGSAQNVTVTARSAGVSKSFAISLKAVVSTMSVSTTSIAFGSIPVNTAATQSVTLTSAGTWPLDINSVSLQGAGFSVSGGTFPAKLSPGQSLALTVKFNPASAGSTAGSLIISSNSSAGTSIAVSLTGTGTQTSSPNTDSSSGTGATYYLAPASAGGKDSNNGLSVGSPWLSPNHSLNCGDVIIALASSAYDSANFNSGHWGTVSCPSGNNVAWLQCESFDGCKISTNVEGMYIDRSYWGVQGFEVSVSGTNGFCFGAAPNYSHPANIHHVIFANNIANGCMGGGFVSFNAGTSGADYLTIVGNIVYNAARGSDQCYSAISIYEPVQSDSAPGTHLYVAGNFAWGNYQPNPCAGIKPWGGDGIIFDTLDGSQHPMPSPYVAQAVAANNMLIGNGGYGIEIQNNVAGSVHAPIFVSNNTVWGNEGNSAMQPNTVFCSEVFLNSAYNVQETSNLVATKAQTACVNNPAYALAGYDIDGTVSVANNFVFGYNNQNKSFGKAPNFTFNPNNIVGQDPKFSNAYVPGAPACGGASNVPDCMASVINNFTPANTAAISTGYQRADSTPVSDPLFPQWVCSANLPTGLTPMGCKAQ